MQANPYYTQSESPPPLLSVQLFHVPKLEGGDKHESLKKAESQREPKIPQKHAKRWVARTRNRLASVALGSESAILWLDSDLESVHPEMVTAMLRSDKDVAVPVVRYGHAFTAWTGMTHMRALDHLSRFQPGKRVARNHRASMEWQQPHDIKQDRTH